MAHQTVSHVPVISNIIWKVKHSVHFIISYGQSVTRQYESTNARRVPLQIKVATTKIHANNFHYKKKPLNATTKSILSIIIKHEWNTKEDTVNYYFIINVWCTSLKNEGECVHIN